FVAALRDWHRRHPPRAAGLEWPEEVRRAQATGAFVAGGLEGGHRLPRHQLLLEHGALALGKRAAAALEALPRQDRECRQKQAFYQSQIVVYRAMAAYGRRWGRFLAQHAAPAADPVRQAELRAMAGICRRVPAFPARTFRQALQATWFSVLINDAECSGTATSFGRLDQYLYPYYAADVRAGRLTPAEALELIECLWLKCYRTFDFHHATVGGLTPDGRDGTNELSWICLEALERLRTPRDVAVRIHRQTPEPFFRRALEIASLGLGRPDFWNDEVTVEALLRKGFPLEDARDYAPIGCVELTIPGQCNSRTMGHAVNLAKILELTLHGGRCPRTGHLVGASEPTDFASYEDLHAAYRRRAATCIRMALEQNFRAYRFQAENLPFPMLSACTVGCLESGRDVMNGGARYNPAGVNLFGVAHVADALAAIRTLVYQEGALPLAALRQAMNEDFHDREPLRRMLLARAPKFGNDDPGVDRVAADEVAFYCREVSRMPTPEGGAHLPLIFGTSPQSVYGMGPATGALPDGRPAGQALATSCNPAHGRNLSGLTAELNSVSSIDFRAAAGGVSYIVDLDPSLVDGPRAIERLAAALRAFFGRGGMEIGINVLREEDLREAQRSPERHRHRMVRVFGFSAQFVSLRPELQEYVIAASRHRE
ncbi:MAG: hypothetical protein JXR77_09640, partial [Lentisphaeria bacterium]|nr:hypothetical protein [Lentisphaeria bacterium]